MERLTYRTGFPDKVKYVSAKLMYDFLLEMSTQDVEKFGDIVNALGGYEDTGLTPYEINQLQAENVALKARLDKAVELPCKVGDKVKVRCDTWGNVWNYVTIDNGKFLVGEIVSITKTRKQTLIKIQVRHNVGWKRERKRYPLSALGVTVFPYAPPKE